MKYVLLFIGVLVVAIGTWCIGMYMGMKEASKLYDSAMHTYQYDLYNDSTVIFYYGEKVGTIPFDSTSHFDKLMTKDNE